MLTVRCAHNYGGPKDQVLGSRVLFRAVATGPVSTGPLSALALRPIRNCTKSEHACHLLVQLSSFDIDGCEKFETVSSESS